MASIWKPIIGVAAGVTAFVASPVSAGAQEDAASVPATAAEAEAASFCDDLPEVLQKPCQLFPWGR